jgi:hypothetical protein
MAASLRRATVAVDGVAGLGRGLDRAVAASAGTVPCRPARSPSTAVTVPAMDVRIGVTQAPRELTVEMPDEERPDTEKAVEAALSGAVDVLWLRDKRGKRVGIPAAKIAYVELGVNDGDRRIGFGG